MPEADGTPPKRTIDERLDALTINFELREAQWQHESERITQLAEKVDKLAEKVDKLAEKVDKLAEKVDKLAEKVDKLADTVHELAASVGELRESVADMRSTLVPAIQNLVLVATAHENRLSRLEKRAS